MGARLQGRRVPLRPDGPPLEGQHAQPARRARRADARRGRRRRVVDLPLRRGLELRRGGQRRPLRAGHAAQHGRDRHRHVQRPAARRRARRRAVRRRRRPRAQPGRDQRPVVRPQRDGRRAPPTQAQLDELLLSADQIRVGLAGNLADYTFVDRTGGDGDRGRRRLQRRAGRLQRRSAGAHRLRRRRTTTRRCGTSASTTTRWTRRTADRVRAQNLGIDFTVLAQGVPFVHAGEDLLRTQADGPQQLRLRRLVQPHRLLRADEPLGRRRPAGRRQRGQLGR